MASGTLVPFMNEVGLPGDTFDIDLECDVLTHPTIGPLFGSYKVQLDVFMTPMRLYNGKLHANLTKIGLNMQNIKLPLLDLYAENGEINGENNQINPSALPQTCIEVFFSNVCLAMLISIFNSIDLFITWGVVL